MGKQKQLVEMSKAQLLKMPNKPEFLKASLRVLEGDGFESYTAAVNSATIIASKEEKADFLFNGVTAYAREGRIIQSTGVTKADMEAALASDFYVINNVSESFVKCTGKDLAEILKDAVKRGEQVTTLLKSQIGFDGVQELIIRPITEYTAGGKFQRYLTDLKYKKDEKSIKRVQEILEHKKYNIETLFEVSQNVAHARYFNIPSDVLSAFEKEIELAKLKKDTGGFF